MKGSAITGPVAKECADIWPRIASNAVPSSKRSPLPPFLPSRILYFIPYLHGQTHTHTSHTLLSAIGERNHSRQACLVVTFSSPPYTTDSHFPHHPPKMTACS